MGDIIVKVTHVGSEIALSHRVQLVKEAQLSKALVQKLVDKISRVFVPEVVVVALHAWLGWFIPGAAHLYPRTWIPSGMDEFELANHFGISILVVACPCTPDLATPTAVMVSHSQRSLSRCPDKGGSALEKAHKVKATIFDKTGTLIVGKPAVVHIKLFPSSSLQEVCDLAAVAEPNSEHPISMAVVKYAKKLNSKYDYINDRVMHAKNFKVHPGVGFSAFICGKALLVGNKRLMFATNFLISRELEKYVAETKNIARTWVLIALDGEISINSRRCKIFDPRGVLMISTPTSLPMTRLDGVELF
ncbi:hypothetical protein KFK09_029265 [Dendrobium nobile]|uniref:Uncharacterized protein n=1 Tax=Dendrobium nobile TaxID=94219 RepID=A0A8T3AA48_DENNO|nr:hypothetical protein KFK09_029265 [Dendrobium nobile]